uniref:Major facilitator superfamily (MFS) profile domain-containing protein n=1 Tax=Plectus sambesii TaxID=2011161 RepID=A0A914VME2_9BILA
MPVGGQLCSSSAGWEAVYYIHAGITVYLFTLWVIFFKDTPHTHLWTSRREVATIVKGKPSTVQRPPPYGKIVTTPSVWAIGLASVANYFAMQLFVVFMPSYFHNALGFPINHAGLLAALPVLAQFFVKLIGASLSDRCHFSSETTKARV